MMIYNVTRKWIYITCPLWFALGQRGILDGGLPLGTYAPRGWVGRVKPPIHFHCVLHAKREGGGPDSMYNCVHT